MAYVGTHDNDTALGWLAAADPGDVRLAREYLKLNEDEGEAWGMMRGVWASPADLAIVQMQDLLCLGSEARMNVPGVAEGNWSWQAAWEDVVAATGPPFLRRRMEICWKWKI